MLVRDKKTGRFLSKKESEKIIAEKRRAYDNALIEEVEKRVKKKYFEFFSVTVVAITATLASVIIVLTVW